MPPPLTSYKALTCLISSDHSNLENGLGWCIWFRSAGEL